MAPFVEDLDEFLETGENGFAHSYIVGVTTATGIFTEANADALEIDGTAPTLLAKDEDVEALAITAGTLVNITTDPPAALFYAREFVEEAAPGFTLIRLERAL